MIDVDVTTSALLAVEACNDNDNAYEDLWTKV